jgi:hypothetical protein
MCNVLYIIVCSSVLLLLTVVRFTDSDYPFGILDSSYVYSQIYFIHVIFHYLENIPFIPLVAGDSISHIAATLKLWINVMLFNATFNNISVISWRSVLCVEETRVPGENYRPAYH